MFDNPKESLLRMQQQLLAQEEEQWEEEEDSLEGLEDLLGEPDEDLSRLFEDSYEEEAQQPLYRNHANHYGADVKNYANHYGRAVSFEEEEYEELDEDAVYYRADTPREQRRRRCRSAVKLFCLACLEITAIILILWWWITWMK